MSCLGLSCTAKICTSCAHRNGHKSYQSQHRAASSLCYLTTTLPTILCPSLLNILSITPILITLCKILPSTHCLFFKRHTNRAVFSPQMPSAFDRNVYKCTTTLLTITSNDTAHLAGLGNYSFFRPFCFNQGQSTSVINEDTGALPAAPHCDKADGMVTV